MGGCYDDWTKFNQRFQRSKSKTFGNCCVCNVACFVMFGSSLIEKVPMAALTGTYDYGSAIGTFEWAERTFTKFPKSDILVMVLVNIGYSFLTLFRFIVIDLELSLQRLFLLGIMQSNGETRKYVDDNGVKHYEIYGPLFFGSTTAFTEKFDILNYPEESLLILKESPE